MSLPPKVVLDAGEDASGIARMVGGVLEANLRDFRWRAGVARRLRGEVVLTDSDHAISVTVRFSRGDVVIAEGADAGAPQIAGPWSVLAGLCSGRRSFVRSLLSREIGVTSLRRPVLMGASGFVLSVPASTYGDSRTRRRIVIAAVCAAAVLAVVLKLR